MSDDASNVPKLVVLDGPERGKELFLRAEEAVIGRTDDADLVVRDKSISRRHAGISRRDGAWFVRDLESKNGVRVNNREVTEQGLRTGDLVTIGGVKMKFIDPHDLAPPPVAAPYPGIPSPPPVPAVQGPPPAPPEGRPAPEDPAAGALPAALPPAALAVPAPPAAPAPGAPPGAPAASGPAVYTPKPQVQAELYAPPPEFFAPAQPVAPKAPASRPLTRGKVLLYAVVCGIVGLGLGYLLWITFGPKEEPFREDAKLAVGEVRLVDLRQYHGLLKSATCRLTVPRIAESSYDADMAILRVEGKALGNAEAAFADAEGRPLGSVGVHVLAGARRKYVDRMALTKEQRKVQAQDLLREGEALAKAHIAEALLKYEMANHLLELEGTEDPALVALAKMRLDDLTAERESRFRKLKDRYRQANKLRDFAVQKDSLDEICKLFPDPSDEENQRAKIFLKRVLASERAQQKKKE